MARERGYFRYGIRVVKPGDMCFLSISGMKGDSREDRVRNQDVRNESETCPVMQLLQEAKNNSEGRKNVGWRKNGCQPYRGKFSCLNSEVGE